MTTTTGFPSVETGKPSTKFRAIAEMGTEQSEQSYARPMASAEDPQKAASTHMHRRQQTIANQKDQEMSKTEDKPGQTAETVEFPAFDPSKATDQLRAVAEKGVEQSKEALAKFQSGAEDTQKVLKSTFETAKSVGNELSLTTIAALRANAEADFSHLEALAGAKSVSEVFELQTTFLRKRVEMGVEQAKDFQTLTTKAATDVSKPVKDFLEKALKDLKAA
jgi:phasin